MIDPALADLVRLIDQLEDRADSYLTLEEVQAKTNQDVRLAIAETILLVDYRTRLDGTPVTLCRLNRHHPVVAGLTSW